MQNERVIKRDTFVQESVDGVISKQQVTTYLVPKEPQFYKIYINDMLNLHEVQSAAKAVFLALLSIGAIGSDNVFELGTYTKRRIAAKAHMSYKAVQCQIYALLKQNIITRYGKNTRNVFMINPHIAVRTKWQQALKLQEKFRIVVDYNEALENRVVSTEIFDSEGNYIEPSIAFKNQVLSVPFKFLDCNKGAKNEVNND
jgi:hypothetical protein